MLTMSDNTTPSSVNAGGLFSSILRKFLTRLVVLPLDKIPLIPKTAFQNLVGLPNLLFQ